MFIGLFTGVILYFSLLSKYFEHILKGIFKIIYKIFYLIFKILLTPARFLYKILLVYFFMPIDNFIINKVKLIKHKINLIKINRSNSNERKNKKKKKKVQQEKI